MGETAKGGGDWRDAGSAEQADGRIAERGQVLRAVARSHLTLILAPRHVADPMQAILDPPMAPPVLEQHRRVGPWTRHAGDGVLLFAGLAAVAKGNAFQAADLR